MTTFAENALESARREQLVDAVRTNKKILDSHLETCNSESNNLREKIRLQQDTIIELSEERDQARGENRELKREHEKLGRYVVEITLNGRRKMVTLAMILGDPGTYVDHEKCEVCPNNLDRHGHEFGAIARHE